MQHKYPPLLVVSTFAVALGGAAVFIIGLSQTGVISLPKVAAKDTQASSNQPGSAQSAQSAPINARGSTSPTLPADSDVQQSTDIDNLQTTGQVSFELGSAQLTRPGTETLDRLSNELKKFSQDTVAVRIIGHASLTGSQDRNQALSQARADAVSQYLKTTGITLDIVAEGKGASEPLPNMDPADACNQRTEVRLVRIEE
ncbi:MAG: OmpA family protein [Phormidesmis sp.]